MRSPHGAPHRNAHNAQAPHRRGLAFQSSSERHGKTTLTPVLHCTRCARDPLGHRSRSAALVDKSRILRQRMMSRRGRGGGSHRTCRTPWATLDQGDSVGVEAGLKLQKATAARKGGSTVGDWFCDGLSKVNIDRGWAGAACEDYVLANCGCPGLRHTAGGAMKFSDTQFV